MLNQIMSITDARQGVTAFTYDANGNLRTLTDARQGVTDYTDDVMDRVTVRQTTTYAYDGLGRLTQVTYADGSTGRGRPDDAGCRLARRHDRPRLRRVRSPDLREHGPRVDRLHV